MRAVIIPFHKYTPFGGEFYEPLLTHLLKTMDRYRGEFDKLYLIDSEWHIPPGNYTILKKQHEGHHWVQFKDAIPYIEEKNMLFLDNDVLILKKGVIDNWFRKIEKYDFVGSFDGSGENRTIANKYLWMKKRGYNRMGSYYFILTRKLLDKVGEYDFAPQEGYDSFGKFTLQMLETKPKIYEIIDDRSSIYFDGTKTPEKGLNLGYYHVRAGSRIAYLLASKKYGHENDYWDSIKNQPKQEYLRQCAWYQYMGGNPQEIVADSGIIRELWDDYFRKFKEYHGL